jgi:Ca2+-binding RTX toxin-like protein
MPLPPIPGDINAAEPALRSEFINYIETLIDAAEPVTVTGGGNDLFLGNDLANLINGQSGNDVLAGFGGNDNINGGEGDDYILAGIGADVVVGGDGNDFLFGEGDNDRMNGDAGDDAMFGGAGIDVMNGGEGNDSMYGNDGNDRLADGFGDDLLDGGSGNDTLTASTGNDEMRGGTGNDILTGGADNDFIEGGAGADRLNGGVGNDVYFYASRGHGADIILNFESANDRFEFSGLGFNVDPGTNLNNGTTFIANAAPVSVAFDATVLYETDTGRLFFDVDGAGAAAAQLIATIQGAPTVTEQDFIFV